ncbi:MAG TPA: AbrB/MazE/SpoVT family DNA-binding domain-containing protein [Egibacteraceae bacterium]|nr:AbrB/MazE/SpoVT family DNA-binding domain-containing protein [Egibacteraceae bacterium]
MRPKNQITLPIDVLQKAGIHSGEVLRVEADGPGRTIFSRVRDPIEEFAGSLTGVYQDGFPDRLRGEWD